MNEPRTPDDPHVPGDSAPRALIVLLGAAGAVITLFGIREVASIIGPIVLALVLVIAVAPVRKMLDARGRADWLQIVIPFLIVFLVLLGMVAILTVSVAQLTALLPAYADQVQVLLGQAQQWAAKIGISPDQLNKSLQSFTPDRILGVAQSLVSGLTSVLSSLFLVVVLLYAMSMDAPATARFISASRGSRPEFVDALFAFAQNTRRYLVVSTVFGIVCAVLDSVALSIVGVPLPLLWGALALITNYIPNIGFVLGLVPPALLALLSGGVSQMLAVLVAYSVINVVVQSFIQPKYLGDAVGLSTTMTFLSLIIWAFVLGPLGALLAVPLSLLTRALLLDSDPRATWAATLISNGKAQNAE